MENTWPGGIRRAIDQSEHKAWNEQNYPGTRQLCVECGEPTGRCEEDLIVNEEGYGPLCESCFCDDGMQDFPKKFL